MSFRFQAGTLILKNIRNLKIIVELRKSHPLIRLNKLFIRANYKYVALIRESNSTASSHTLIYY